ncbi:nuclear transport factor 2 family protein [Rhodococcus sp. HNM0569]|uniref:nuclear transport factor 2 family protein n=1 Tax=Rhodococcus sp. HNM0569 TaxID=2716340 RepID=UPI00146BB2B5|nr:nuclear transport factor 2 family protein [Rhodococcus sp. HNM0569]NLU82271.1 nuclear transport factor 2 family protein [Rhodococcus sp. HNM0569]
METAERSRRLEFVQRSPAAVAAHDKKTWVGLFAPDGVVNDPVGSRPQVGHDALGRFYDAFIAPNDIVFDVAHDYVCGDLVVRDLHIEITMGSGARVRVPMHLGYRLTGPDGAFAIADLQAFWQLPAMVVQLLRQGLPGLRASSVLGPRLIRTLGISGCIGFLAGMRGVHGRGRARAERVLQAARGDRGVGEAARGSAVRAALGGDAELRWGSETVSTSEFAARLGNLRWHKVIAAGRSVTVSLDGPVSSGNSHDKGEMFSGVAFFAFDSARRVAAVDVVGESVGNSGVQK